MQSKRIILTGGPGTGKTSIISHLKEEGHSCFEEISREIIRDELEKGSNVLPWSDLNAFTHKVLEGRVTDYKAAKDPLCFYDRSVYDAIAYLHLDGVEVLPEWDSLGRELAYYPTVFITPPWKEIFHQDNERKESYQQLVELHEVLIKTYQSYGYELLEVPKLSIADRAHYILNHLETHF